VLSAGSGIWTVVEEAWEIVFKIHLVELEVSRELVGSHQLENDPVISCFRTVAVAMVVNLVGSDGGAANSWNENKQLKAVVIATGAALLL
jgi:hypothetical protein